MKGIVKPFDQDLYDEVDKKGKKAVIKYAQSCGYKLTENGNIYGVDLVGKAVRVEVQVSRFWWNEYPYPLICIFERKKKFITGSTLFFECSADCTQAYIINDSQLTEENLKQVPWSKEEYAYFIDPKKCKHVFMEG